MNFTPLYLFAGQDSPAKDVAFDKAKKEFLQNNTRCFNLDIIYAKDTTLKELQEKLLYCAFKSEKRIVAVKNCQALKQDIKDFLISYADKPNNDVLLILDIDIFDPKDKFTLAIKKTARLFLFKQDQQQNVFDLCRQVEEGQAAAALRILNQLLKKGNKPELILGGIRSHASRRAVTIEGLKKTNKLLIECDVAIKTGALKPAFALERLIVSLCGFKNTFS